MTYHWTYTVACNEKGKTKGRFHPAHSKVHHYGFGASAVDRGSDVDGEGKETYLGGHKDFFECRPIQWHLI